MMHAFTSSNWVIVASSWPGVQTCVSAQCGWWALISGAGVYCACAYVCVAGQNQATCDGMDDMIERSTALSCTKTPACNRADCTPTNVLLRGYSLSIELLSCRTPPY